MNAKEKVLQVLRVLAPALGELEESLDAAAWQSLRTELVAMLGEIDRCQTAEQWEAIWTKLLTLSSRSRGVRRLIDDAGAVWRGRDPDPTVRGEHHVYRGPAPGHPVANMGPVPGATAELRRRLGEPEVAPPVTSPEAKVAPIETYPEVSGPAEVKVGATFFVEVVARCTPSSDLQPSITIERATDGPIDLEVVVALPADGGIAAVGLLEQSLRVPAGLDSATLKFSLVAERLGLFELHVHFLYEGVERLSLPLKVGVVESLMGSRTEGEKGAGVLKASSVVRMAPGRPSGFCLFVEKRAHSEEWQSLRLTLKRDRNKTIDVWGEVPIDTPANLLKLCRDMHAGLGGVLMLEQTKAKERRIQAIGADLSRKLLLNELMAALRDADEGTELHIMSDDAWFPWEMLRLNRSTKREGVFLGEHFAVTRGLRLAQSWPVVGGGQTVLVAPSGSGLSPDKERQALTGLTGCAPEELRTVLQTQERLIKKKRLAVLHFACHGKADFNQKELLAGWLALEHGSLRPIDVRESDSAKALQGSLVFVNACEADVPTRSLSGHGGWADAFLRAGAGAFVAPSWAVFDHTASAFAVRFYEELGAGRSLGEAGRLARLAARQEGNPDRLAYAVYAAPGARFGRGAAGME